MPPDVKTRAQQACSSLKNHRKTWDLGIAAPLGIGVTRAQEGKLAEWLGLFQRSLSPCLCVDMPSGLEADIGCWQAPTSGLGSLPPTGPRHTLSLLTLKPGLFTAQGRDPAANSGSMICGAPPPPIWR